ncbi:hypothetical protein Pla52n_49210 [Stieleria varia]|uniref:Uncharacterized protein n=1 Tax=Stieleria varia TaxID=2528005 RepID=A0A5C6AGH6_9BACT|nr:hypothetical protein Pla52n_49210 [Stieleria varia]
MVLHKFLSRPSGAAGNVTDTHTAQGGWFVFGRMVVFVFDLESRTTIVARLSKSIACRAKRFAIPNH